MSFIFAVRPTRWEVDHAHALKAGAEFASAHDGRLPGSAFWRDVESRYDRDAEAFSINHPNLKRFLDSLILERAEDACLSGMISSPQMPWREAPRIPLVACDPPSPRTASLETPEPASVVGASICFVLLAAYWRAKR